MVLNRSAFTCMIHGVFIFDLALNADEIPTHDSWIWISPIHPGLQCTCIDWDADFLSMPNGGRGVRSICAMHGAFVSSTFEESPHLRWSRIRDFNWLMPPAPAPLENDAGDEQGE